MDKTKSFTYDINTSKKDNRSSVSLFLCHTLNNIVNMFLSSFLIAHIYTFSNGIFDYILKVCMYEISYYFVFAVCTLIVSRFVDNSSRIWYYRIGMALRCGLVILAVFYGHTIAKILLLAGFLNGVSYGFYYSSYNVMKQEMVSRKSIKNFAMLGYVIQYSTNIGVPVLLGMLIDISTYSQVAIYILCVCVIQIGISFLIRSKKPEGSHFSLKEYFEKLKSNPEVFKKMKFLYLTSTVYGCTTIVATLVDINIMMQFGTSLSLGIFSSVFSAISIVVILLVNKFTVENKRNWLFKVSAFVPFVCTLIFAIVPSITTLIIYNAGVYISGIIYKTIYDFYRNYNLKQDGIYSEIGEHQAVVEVLLNAVRSILYLILLLVGLINNLIVFKIFLCIFSLSYSGTLIMLMLYENKFFKPVNANPLEQTTTNIEKDKDK